MVSHINIRKSPISRNFEKYLWMIYAAAVLFQVGVPSLTPLYTLDKTTIASQVSLGATERHWYWSYEHREGWSGSCQLSFDSHMVPPLEKLEGGPGC